MVWEPFYVKCDSLGLSFMVSASNCGHIPAGGTEQLPRESRRHQELFQEVRDVVSYRLSLPGR